MSADSLIASFAAAAEAARREEDAYRREAAERIAWLARERTHAFRRMNLVRTIADAIGAQEDPAIAAAAARAAVVLALDWSETTPGRAAVLEQLQPVFEAAASEMLEDGPPPQPPLADRLRAFEDWYEATTKTSFYALFDRYVPETPVVDF